MIYATTPEEIEAIRADAILTKILRRSSCFAARVPEPRNPSTRPVRFNSISSSRVGWAEVSKPSYRAGTCHPHAKPQSLDWPAPPVA
jgi:hypothetical protein